MVVAGYLPRNGSASKAWPVVRNKPTWIMSWGARRRQKTRQSMRDMGPRTIERRLGVCDVGHIALVLVAWAPGSKVVEILWRQEKLVEG